MRWYDEYLERGSADRSANPTPGNKRGGLANVVEKALGSVGAWAAGGLMRRKYLAHTRRTTWEVLRSITDDPRLAGVLGEPGVGLGAVHRAEADDRVVVLEREAGAVERAGRRHLARAEVDPLEEPVHQGLERPAVEDLDLLPARRGHDTQAVGALEIDDDYNICVLDEGEEIGAGLERGESFTSIAFTCSMAALSRNASGSKRPLLSLQPK